MSINNCPFKIEELEEILSDDGPGWEPVKQIHIEIDDNKKEVRWKNKGDTWTRRMSYEVLNVWKITGKHPISVFMHEYRKSHPNVSGAFMPNIPGMLEKWAKEFNEAHQEEKNDK